jgi:hypothetical protein
MISYLKIPKGSKFFWLVCLVSCLSTLSSCSNQERVPEQERAQTEVEIYIEHINPQLNIKEGKSIVIFLPSNGCISCFEKLKELILTTTSPAIKYIYSIEHKGRADLEIVKYAWLNSKTVYLDYSNKPYKRGIVKDVPTAYFLDDGQITNSVIIDAVSVDQAIPSIMEFAGRVTF